MCFPLCIYTIGGIYYQKETGRRQTEAGLGAVEFPARGELEYGHGTICHYEERDWQL
jgi:hypothetical protein